MSKKIFVILIVFVGCVMSGLNGFSQSFSMDNLFNTTVINRGNMANIKELLEKANREERALVIIESDVPGGELPIKISGNTRVMDLRYGKGINLVRGNHPRLEGIWPQYSGLKTGLRQNFILSDVIPHNADVTDWKSITQNARPLAQGATPDYHDNHNHYQNFLSEVWNFSNTVNGVSIWGDSGAFVPGSKVWGGFLSARSWPVYWEKYVPDGRPHFEEKDFDAQLVGLEIDVLNGGKAHPSKFSKTGVQIVGFGNENSQAVEIRSEDSDVIGGMEKRKGAFNYGIIFYNGVSAGGTLIKSAQTDVKTGLDFGETNFLLAAVKLGVKGKSDGVMFGENGKGGGIYSDGRKLVIEGGTEGLDLRGVTNDAVALAKMETKISRLFIGMVVIAMAAVVSFVLNALFAKRIRYLERRAANVPI